MDIEILGRIAAHGLSEHRDLEVALGRVGGCDFDSEDEALRIREVSFMLKGEFRLESQGEGDEAVGIMDQNLLGEIG